jgi:hypothetical protein
LFLFSVLIWGYPMYIIRVSLIWMVFYNWTKFKMTVIDFVFSAFQSPGIYWENPTIASSIGTWSCGSVG